MPDSGIPNGIGGLRIGYADPPYPGCAHMYKNHRDYGGEVDHAEIVYRLVHDYDGYCLHTSSVALADVLARFQIETNDMPRVMAWVKPFAAFKRNVSVAYAWEPVLVKEARKPVVTTMMTYRDWCSEPITLQRGLTGAKPERVCHWLFEVMGCERDDELYDLYPGTNAVSRAWETWRNQLRIEVPAMTKTTECGVDCGCRPGSCLMTEGSDDPTLFNANLVTAEDEQAIKAAGAPYRCCQHWPECSHVEAWVKATA